MCGSFVINQVLTITWYTWYLDGNALIELPWRWKTVTLLENREGNNWWHKLEKMFFSYTEHLRCISNINTYGTFASTCVYYIWKSTRDLGYHYFGTYPDIPSNLWNQQVLLSSSRIFFLHIYLPVWCRCSPMQALLEDAQGILSLILHLTISGCGIDATNEARATGVSPWMRWNAGRYV